MKTALRIVGSGVLVTLLAWRMDWPQLGEAFARLDLGYWLGALLVFLLAQLLSSVRWQWIARPLGFDQPWSRFVALYYLGMFFNLVLPTSVGGDVVRAWYLGAPSGRRGAALLSVLAERASGLAVLILLACAAVVTVYDQVPPWMSWLTFTLGLGLVCGMALLPISPRLARLPWLGSKLAPLLPIVRTYQADRRLLVSTTGFSLLVQLASVAQVWLISQGLGLEISFGYLAVCVPLVSLLTLLPVSVNGMGLREAGLVLLLAPQGITAAQAVTLSLLQFAVLVAASSLGAGIYLAGAYPRLTNHLEGSGNDQPVRCDSDQGRKRQSSAAA